MSDNKDDLELEALQRRLDDAFATTRPRRGFEDELWLRMQARRLLGKRLGDVFASFGTVFREAPAIPIGAVAVLLVVVIGAGILLNSGLSPNKETRGAFSQAGAPNDLALSEFGRLPTPALHPGLVDQRVPAAVPYAPQLGQPSNLYFGPATLRWTGQLPLGVIVAPVYRYSEPGVSAADQFAASLGASSTNQAHEPGYLGAYSGQGFSLSVRSTVSQLPREPYFVLNLAAGFAAGGEPQAPAPAFLGSYSLAPSWPNVVLVQQVGNQARVQFLRGFQVAGGDVGYVVDWNGERYGIEVDLAEGQVRSASGPLPLILDATTYRLISNDEAIRMALASSPASSQGITPAPSVDLNKVELVYALAVSNGQGFYEPAYLFSGTFSYSGQTYTKRVLVPLVDPSLRS